MNFSLGAVPGTDPAVILPERRVSDPVTADLYTLALDTEVGGLVVGAGGPVNHIVSGVVIFLRSHQVYSGSRNTTSPWCPCCSTPTYT